MNDEILFPIILVMLNKKYDNFPLDYFNNTYLKNWDKLSKCEKNTVYKELKYCAVIVQYLKEHDEICKD